jgi:SsrA-binding protein
MNKQNQNTDIVSNPKARRDYQIDDTFEAGIVLVGTEVKSIRAGKGQINEAFARVEKGEVWLYNAYIEEYTHGNRMNHEPRSKRKLLLKKSEIRKLFDQGSVKGNSIIPLKLYWKDRRVKVLLGVGKGKAVRDKRNDMQKRDSDREMKRAMMDAMKGR